MAAVLDHVRIHKSRHDALSQQRLRNALSEFPGRICGTLFFAEHVPEEHVSRSLFTGRAVSPAIKTPPIPIGGIPSLLFAAAQHRGAPSSCPTWFLVNRPRPI